MKNNNLLGQKEIGTLHLKNINNSNKNIIMNYSKEIIIQSYIEDKTTQNIIVIFTDIMDKSISMLNPQYIKCENIIYKTNNKTFNKGEYIKKERIFKNMRLCYKEEFNSYGKITEYMLVFCSNDMKSSNVKKELNNILNRKQSEIENNRLTSSLSEIYYNKDLENLELINYKIQELKDEVYKMSKEINN